MLTSTSKKARLVLTISLVTFLFVLPSLSTAAFSQRSSAKETVIENPQIGGYSTCDFSAPTLTCAHGSATAVYAEFAVPVVTCNPTEGVQGEGFFAGLINSITAGPFGLAGVTIACTGGSPFYIAVVSGPDTSIPFSNLYLVNPGDMIKASLTLVHGMLYYSVIDTTSGGEAKGLISGVDNSLGAVSALVGVTPSGSYLEQFSKVQITSHVTINGKTIPLGASSPAKAILTDSTGTITEAVPSGFSSRGTAFSITWVGN
jgi:hypothetical protein